ncbi:MAG: hypothetical protein HUU29_14055 [Planctomycetaceae bacterium]|nr:hypothetical protein [Planctomycetaceae bacterium]
MNTSDETHGKTYWEFVGRLFNYEFIPQYAVINPDGEVTAWESDISVFDVNVTTGEGGPETVKKFQEFLDTAKGKGEPFDFDKGFHRPANAPAKP